MTTILEPSKLLSRTCGSVEIVNLDIADLDIIDSQTVDLEILDFYVWKERNTPGMKEVLPEEFLIGKTLNFMRSTVW